MQLIRSSITIFAAVLCVLSMGCGSSSVAVSGKVLIDNEPLPEGRIALRPMTQSGNVRAVQTVITDGAYSFTKNQKIAPGNYSVVITGRRKSGHVIPPEEGSSEVIERYEQYLPAKYNIDTELTAQITGDSSDLDFELELPKSKRRRK